jgi:hypothetical protein
VTVQERYNRRGHLAAVLLLEGQRALGVQLKRLLFAQGFEVLHLTGSELSRDALPEAIRATQTAGIVLIYSGNALDKETKRLISADAEERFYNCAESGDLPDTKKKSRGRPSLSRSLCGMLDHERIGQR